MNTIIINNKQLYSSKSHLFDPTSDRFNFNLWSQAVRQQMLTVLQNKSSQSSHDKD